jgi:hypothetical protein
MAQGNLGLFPVEIVAAVLEIKSRLRASDVHDAVANVASVKALRRTGKPFGGILAFSSDSSVSSLTSAFEHANAYVSNDRCDALVVLNTVCLYWEGFDRAPSQYGRSVGALPTADALLFFYLALHEALARPETRAVPVADYVGDFSDLIPPEFIVGDVEELEQDDWRVSRWELHVSYGKESAVIEVEMNHNWRLKLFPHSLRYRDQTESMWIAVQVTKAVSDLHDSEKLAELVRRSPIVLPERG